MEWGRRQPFLTTNNMADLHQMIIDDVGKVIGRQVICGFVQHFVIKDVGVDDYFATNQIVYMHILVGLHLEANYIFLALVHKRLHFFCAHRQ